MTLWWVLNLLFENILVSRLSEAIEYYLNNSDEVIQIINGLKNYLFSLFKGIDSIDLYL